MASFDRHQLDAVPTRPRRRFQTPRVVELLPRWDPVQEREVFVTAAALSERGAPASGTSQTRA